MKWPTPRPRRAEIVFDYRGARESMLRAFTYTGSVLLDEGWRFSGVTGLTEDEVSGQIASATIRVQSRYASQRKFEDPVIRVEDDGSTFVFRDRNSTPGDWFDDI